MEDMEDEFERARDYTIISRVEARKMLVQPLLSYVICSLQHESEDTVTKAVFQSFTLDEILEAKEKYWEFSGEERLGKFPKRIDTVNRTAKEAHVSGIVHKLKQYTGKGWAPTICIMEPYSLRKIPEEEDEVTLTDRIHRLERKMVLMVNTVGTLVTENQCLQEKLDNVCKEPTGIRKTFAETVAAPKVKPVSQEATVPTGGPTVVTNKMDPAHGSSLNKDKEYKEDKENEVSKMTSENSNAKSDQPDDRKFLIPREHIKRNRKKRKQVITGKGSSTGNVMGAPEPVRHLFVKRISKDTNDEDVFTMMEQNGFTVKELKCISHPQAQFKSYKLAVPRSEFNKLFDENLWPKGVFVRTYWSQKPVSK